MDLAPNLITLAALAWVLYRQLTGRFSSMRRLVVMPIVLIVAGLAQALTPSIPWTVAALAVVALEARRAVSALRTEPVDMVQELRELVAATPGAELEVDGEPGGWTASERETLLRTAQEALTNARKHAPGAPVQVRLVPDGTGVELVVQDRGGPPGPRKPGGNGLVGMAERAALVGAELEAGPVADGWRVRLHLPEWAGVPA